MINFEARLINIGDSKIIRIPLKQSEKLPSRGMVMVKIIINEKTFITPLEPDGRGSHWFEVSDLLCTETGLELGEIVSLSMEVVDEWIEADIPQDIMNMIIKSDVLEKWDSITRQARWDWLRWIRSTKNKETRNKRIDVMCSKLLSGDKRPCCFDRTRCTNTLVSKSGVLLVDGDE